MKYAFFLLTFFTALLLSAAPLKLAENGKTRYTIVLQANAGKVDQFAAKELAFFLKKITGATFPVVNTGKKHTASPAIRIGNAKGKQLPDDVSMIETSGSDLLLYGGGVHGNLWAVYELLENSFGCIFLNGFGDFYAPAKSVLTLPETKKRTSYAFRARAIMIYFYKDTQVSSLSHYRNRQNLLLHSRNHPRFPGKDQGIENLYEVFTNTHSLGQLIPAGVKEVKTGFHAGSGILDALPELKNKRYFITNPEFFSMNSKGKRIPNSQLCFSNPELRKELQKNIRMYYDLMYKRTGGLKGHMDISCNDSAFRLCHCKNCIALEKKYGTSGAPLMYALYELARNNPDITFRTLAYQRTQSQRPPKGLGKFPENLIIIFAPINGDYANPLDKGKENKIDYDDFKGWCKMTRNILFWYYPNIYNRSRDRFFFPPPNGAIKRIARDIQIMSDHKILGTYFEHDSGGITTFTNFSEMQSWIMLKLFQDPKQDLDKLITKFLNVYYGPAAPILKKYHSELVAELDKFTAAGGRWHYRFIDANYLTKENLLRWDKMLDQAEKAVTGEYAFRVRLLRMGLDGTIVSKINDRSDFRMERIRKTLSELLKKRPVKFNWNGYNKWCRNMKNRGEVLPLPREFSVIPETIVIPAAERGRTVVALKGANLGRAYKETRAAGKNFSMGLYDQTTKTYSASRTFRPGEIESGSFDFYLINSKPVTLTPTTLCYGGSWQMNYFVGRNAVNRDDAASLKRKFYIFVSLKEENGAIYSDRAYVVPADKAVKALFLPREPGRTKLPAAMENAPGLIVVPIPKYAKAKVADPAANYKRALPEVWDGRKAFLMGLYHSKLKKYSAGRRLNPAEVPIDGKYHLVKLTTRPEMITKNTVFYAGRWTLSLHIGKEADTKKKYHIYISLKREAKRLLGDKVVLIPAKQ